MQYSSLRTGSKRPVDRPSSSEYHSVWSATKGQFNSHWSTDQYSVIIHWSLRLPVTPVLVYRHRYLYPVPGNIGHTWYTGVRLNQSELFVLNSPVTPVQLEHNVHESLGNMPSVQDERSSEHSQAFQGLLNSYSPDDSADEFPERSPLWHSGHLSLGIGHTSNP